MTNMTREESFIDWLDGAEPEAREQSAFFYAWNRQQEKIDRLQQQIKVLFRPFVSENVV